MDILLEKWLDESIGDCDTMVEVPRISLRAALYAESRTTEHRPGHSRRAESETQAAV